MTMTTALTEDEVRDVIEAFWRLDADKAHLVEFLPIMDDEFVIRAVSEAGEEVVRFDGLAGLEDHQDGKMDIFDEAFELTSLRVEVGPGHHRAHDERVDVPAARAPRAAQRILRCRPVRMCGSCAFTRHGDGPVMTGHTCTRFEFRPGQVLRRQ